jgi:hypothetical protein
VIGRKVDLLEIQLGYIFGQCATIRIGMIANPALLHF